MELNKPAEDQADEALDASAGEAAMLELVAELVREIRPTSTASERIRLDASLDRDLGIDSLARVELIARTERRFDVSLPENVLVGAESPRELLRAVLAARGTSSRRLDMPLVDTHSEQVGATPEQAQTLVEVLQWHVGVHPDRTHIQLYDDQAQGDVISYRELWEQASTVAAGLQRRGLQRGDTVALMLPTGSDYFYSFYGILLAGGVPVPIYPPMRASQIEDHLRRQGRILSNCRAVMMITVSEARLVAQLLISQVDTLRYVLTVAEICRDAGSVELIAPTAADTGFIQYTSGSTGDPKGVVLSHANLVANVRLDGEVLHATSDDVFVSWLPLYHDMGLIGAWLGSLYHSVRLVIMSPLAFLARPERWLRAVHRYGGTLSAAPNFAYELCLNRIDERDLEGLDLSSWRMAMNGAEPISAITLERFCERFGRYGFRREAMSPVYGLAECSVGLTMPPVGRGPLIDRIERDSLMRRGEATVADADDAHALELVACGQPLPGHEIRVVDAQGHELPERQEGELQFRGPSATSGYFRNPTATEALFQDGWLRTGDLAYVAAGDLYLTGRTKDIIIRAGRNIYPTELEEAIGEIDGVRKGRVAVFGTEDRDAGTERLVVLAETREQDPAARERMRDAINALATDLVLAPPDDIVLAGPGAVLKTSSGKIRRAASRERYERGEIDRPQSAVWLQITRLFVAGLRPRLRRAGRAAVALAYATYAWALFGLSAPLLWLVAMAPVGAGVRWSVLRHLIRGLLRIGGIRLSVDGVEQVPEPGTSCVMVSNHQSYLDSFMMVAALPRQLSFLAKAELQRFAPVRWGLRRMDTQFVEREDIEHGLRQAAQASESVLSGRTLFIFAEGTFKRMPGLLPFRMGAFMTAAQTRVPLVPIAIRGSRSILRSGSWFPHPGAVSVTVCEPITGDTDRDAWEAALQLRDTARQHILRHSGEPDLMHESNRPID